MVLLLQLLQLLLRYFFCGSFMFLFCLVFAMSLCASVYMCFVVTCWERADLLALVCGVCCEFVTFPLVSWVRCGTLLYRFLIFAPLLTFIMLIMIENSKLFPYFMLCSYFFSKMFHYPYFFTLKYHLHDKNTENFPRSLRSLIL